MRLIGAWTTTIDGVPAAVLAYRCHDRLVVQYVVPEHVFFRPPRVREAIATSGLYAAGEGKIHAVGWPGRDNGSFLVGEFTAAELAAMRISGNTPGLRSVCLLGMGADRAPTSDASAHTPKE